MDQLSFFFVWLEDRQNITRLGQIMLTRIITVPLKFSTTIYTYLFWRPWTFETSPCVSTKTFVISGETLSTVFFTSRTGTKKTKTPVSFHKIFIKLREDQDNLQNIVSFRKDSDHWIPPKYDDEIIISFGNCRTDDSLSLSHTEETLDHWTSTSCIQKRLILWRVGQRTRVLNLMTPRIYKLNNLSTFLWSNTDHL